MVYFVGPKLYCADFGDGTDRTCLDGRVHVKMKGTGLSGNDHVLGPATFEKLVRKQMIELHLEKFSMDRPSDFSVAAADGTFRINADLSDKRLDVGYTEWHGCELLVTRPWTATDRDAEHGHPLCVPMKEPCSICLAPLSSCTPTQLPCGHNFHAACMRRWSTTSGTCPMCRAPTMA